MLLTYLRLIVPRMAHWVCSVTLEKLTCTPSSVQCHCFVEKNFLICHRPPFSPPFWIKHTQNLSSLNRWNNSSVGLTIEGVDASVDPLSDGVFHLSSPHTLDPQVLETTGERKGWTLDK